MGRKTNVFILIPLATLASVILGFAIYNTLCKNANIPLGC